jgi:hypothetical protein
MFYTNVNNNNTEASVIIRRLQRLSVKLISVKNFKSNVRHSSYISGNIGIYDLSCILFLVLKFLHGVRGDFSGYISENAVGPILTGHE